MTRNHAPWDGLASALGAARAHDETSMNMVADHALRNELHRPGQTLGPFTAAQVTNLFSDSLQNASSDTP